MHLPPVCRLVATRHCAPSPLPHLALYTHAGARLDQSPQLRHGRPAQDLCAGVQESETVRGGIVVATAWAQGATEAAC